MRLRWAVAAAMVAFTLTGSREASAGTESPSYAAYRVDVRDVLVVDVYGEEELSGEFVVGDGGVIDVPLAGQVEVSGLTTLEVALRLEQVLGERFLVNPQVTVRMDSYGSKPVQVLGAVKQPGVYYLTGPTSLLEILAQSGGIDSENTIKEVHVSRGDAAPIVVNLDALVTHGTGNLVLQADDVVYVPEGLVVYVAGQVANPGEVAFAEGLTVTQAMTKAGGWTATASLKYAYILREGERTRINLRRIMQGKEADIALRPGDQVYIQESVF